VRTLDELCRNGVVRALDFIKCDVEGSELEVLQGASELLNAARPGLLLEVSKEASEGVFALLSSFGYEGFVYPGKLEKTRNYRDKEFSNYLFFHPASRMWQRLNLQ
jgi:hypothetical protein